MAALVSYIRLLLKLSDKTYALLSATYSIRSERALWKLFVSRTCQTRRGIISAYRYFAYSSVRYSYLLLFRVAPVERVRAISTARLCTSPYLHLQPIYVVVYNGPVWRSYLGVGFVLRCFQHLSRPDADTRQCSWRHNR